MSQTRAPGRNGEMATKATTYLALPGANCHASATQLSDYYAAAQASTGYGSHVSASTALQSQDDAAQTAPQHPQSSCDIVHQGDISTTSAFFQGSPEATHASASHEHALAQALPSGSIPELLTLASAHIQMMSQYGQGCGANACSGEAATNMPAGAWPAHRHHASAQGDALAEMQRLLLQAGASNLSPMEAKAVLAASHHSFMQPQVPNSNAHGSNETAAAAQPEDATMQLCEPVTAAVGAGAIPVEGEAKAPSAPVPLALDDHNDNASDEPPRKVVCGSRKGSPAGAANQRDTQCMERVLFNPQYPFPARPVRPPHLAPLPCPLGSTWAPSVQAGPPLIVPEGFELPTECKLAPQPELVPQKPPKPPAPTALLSRWAVDCQAALLAAQGRTPPVPRKAPKPRRTANRGRSRQRSPATKAAAAAAIAAAAGAGSSAVAVAAAVPSRSAPGVPDTQALLQTSNGAGQQGSCDLNAHVGAPDVDVGRSTVPAAGPRHMTRNGSGQDGGLPPLPHMPVKQGPIPQLVEMAHEWWEVRLQWQATAEGSQEGSAEASGSKRARAPSVWSSEGDVCVARFLEASHAQTSLLCTSEMLTLRAVPGPLPDLQQEWQLDNSLADNHTEQAMLEREAAEAGALLRVKCCSCREKWYLVRRTDPTAAHELVQRPVTIQESPWRRLMSWHHAVGASRA